MGTERTLPTVYRFMPDAASAGAGARLRALSGNCSGCQFAQWPPGSIMQPVSRGAGALASPHPPCGSIMQPPSRGAGELASLHRPPESMMQPVGAQRCERKPSQSLKRRPGPSVALKAAGVRMRWSANARAMGAAERRSGGFTAVLLGDAGGTDRPAPGVSRKGSARLNG